MSDSPQAYAITAAEGCDVHLDDSSEDEKFTISVRNAEGAEIESHPGLTAATVGAVASEHFGVEYVDAPVPAAADGE